MAPADATRPSGAYHAAPGARVAATATDGIPSVFGWSEPEPAMTGSTSKGGGAVLCDGAPNLSFWTHVNNGTAPVLPYNRLVHALNRSEHYIAWQTNEVISVQGSPRSSYAEVIPPHLHDCRATRRRS
jgi:hypothetical protein